jgi:hypothetical protein
MANLLEQAINCIDGGKAASDTAAACVSFMRHFVFSCPRSGYIVIGPADDPRPGRTAAHLSSGAVQCLRRKPPCRSDNRWDSNKKPPSRDRTSFP